MWPLGCGAFGFPEAKFTAEAQGQLPTVALAIQVGPDLGFRAHVIPRTVHFSWKDRLEPKKHGHSSRKPHSPKPERPTVDPRALCPMSLRTQRVLQLTPSFLQAKRSPSLALSSEGQGEERAEGSTKPYSYMPIYLPIVCRSMHIFAH